MALTKTAPTQAPAEREEPTRWMGKPLVLLLACLIVLTIFGFSFIQDPSRSAQTRDPAWYTWRVGLITDQTGPLSFMGIANVNVANMVIDDINARGGLLGRPVELFIEDSATDDSVAEAAAAKSAAVQAARTRRK